MTYIKNNKVLVFIIAVLLLSNIAVLFFFLRKDKKEDKQKTPREYMIEKLKKEVGFTDDQITQYIELSDKHKQVMKPLFDDIHMAKDSFYKLLNVEPTDSMLSHYLVRIGEKQKTIDQKIFNHFLSLKHLCTADQLPKYDTVIQHVIKGMINPPKKGMDKKK